MAIPTGVILMWEGTNASIPSGWTRETDLDGKHIKGTADSTDPNDTGGSNTHTHTSDAHTHSIVDHSHDVTVNAAGPSVGNQPGGTTADTSHTHGTSSIGNTSGGDLSDAITYQSANHEPPYHEVIFIKPDGSPANVPDDVIALFHSTTLPTNWVKCDGGTTTPDLTDKFLKGAAAAGDGGGTGGGSTHSHTVDHSHTTQSHSHSGTSNGANNITRSNAGGTATMANHTHTITLNSSSNATNSYTGTAGSAETVLPAYTRTFAIQNTSGGTVAAPLGLIGLWLGTLANIPNNWVLCDGTNDTPDMRGQYLYLTNTNGELGDTGGSNSHTHAASNSHTHTSTGTHTHTGSTSTAGTNSNVDGDAGVHSSASHSHSLNTISSETATYGNATISANSSANEPAYLTVAFIKLNTVPGGAILMSMM